MITDQKLAENAAKDVEQPVKGEVQKPRAFIPKLTREQRRKRQREQANAEKRRAKAEAQKATIRVS